MDTLNIIIELMTQNKCDNKKLAEALGLNRQVVTDWKAGRSKSYKKYLPQLSDYFAVSVDYLLGKTDEQTEQATATVIELKDHNFTEHECQLIAAYRAKPEMQAAVDKLLGLNEDGYVRIYSAARSMDKKPDNIITLQQEDWERIKNAPETDETLI